MEDGNGHIEDAAIDQEVKNLIKERRGAVLGLEDIDRKDGIFAEHAQAQIRGSGNQGVLVKLLTAVENDHEYRQVLKTARWPSQEDADRTWAALKECALYGVSPTFVLDRVICWQAGVGGELVKEVLDGLTHTTFTTNRQGGSKGWWPFGRNNNRNTGVPLS